MPVIQLTGLSGAGKSTLAYAVKELLEQQGISCVVVDGDECRKTICRDLGFSKADREENIRRLGMLADKFAKAGQVAIIAAINPFDSVRMELQKEYGAHTIWIRCDQDTLIRRDTKGLYRRALLPDDHPDKIYNLTGINDPYETPANPDLVIDTGANDTNNCIQAFLQFILRLQRQ